MGAPPWWHGRVGGADYLQAPKIGSLFQAGSAKPFEDYPVAGKWIFQLVQMQKITFSAARAELVKTGENLCRVLPDLDRHHAESTAARLHQRAAAVQDMLRFTDCRSVRVPEVEAWKARYGRGVWRRKKFLVLEGQSGTGKTEFARGLYGALETLELNCAINQPSFNHQSTNQPSINQPSTSHETTINQPSIHKQSSINQSSISHQPSINQPSINHQPSINQPSIKQPAIQQSTINQSSINHQ